MALSPFWYEHSVCSHTPPVSLNERMRGTRMIHHRPKQGLCKIQPGWKQGWRHLYVWKATASLGQRGQHPLEIAIRPAQSFCSCNMVAICCNDVATFPCRMKMERLRNMKEKAEMDGCLLEWEISKAMIVLVCMFLREKRRCYFEVVPSSQTSIRSLQRWSPKD